MALGDDRMNVLERFLYRLGGGDRINSSEFYEVIQPPERWTKDGREYEGPPKTRGEYESLLDAQVRYVLSQHFPEGTWVVRRKVDLFTEQGGRRVWRMRIWFQIPSPVREPTNQLDGGSR